MECDFSDIINEKRPEHKDDDFAHRHPKMRRQDRAKIFAPFAALNGHKEQIKEREMMQTKAELYKNDSD